MRYTRGLRNWLVIAPGCLLLLCAGGCRAEKGKTVHEAAAPTLKVTSTAFENGANIPPQYTCDGKNISPELKLEGIPAATKSLALIVDDQDAPTGTFVHWIWFNIPPEKNELPEGMPQRTKLDDGSVQGMNDFDQTGYGGPCPPGGKSHRYHFRVRALDTTLDAKAGKSKIAMLSAMDGHILASGELMGRYQK